MKSDQWNVNSLDSLWWNFVVN